MTWVSPALRSGPRPAHRRRPASDTPSATSVSLSSFGQVTHSEAARSAVTNRSNMSSFAPPGDALAVHQQKAIAEFQTVADIGADEARAGAREAVAAVGGWIEPRRKKGGLAAGRIQVHHFEVWWVPRAAVAE
jgi:hypothetical protein